MRERDAKHKKTTKENHCRRGNKRIRKGWKHKKRKRNANNQDGLTRNNGKGDRDEGERSESQDDQRKHCRRNNNLIKRTKERGTEDDHGNRNAAQEDLQGRNNVQIDQEYEDKRSTVQKDDKRKSIVQERNKRM